MNVLEVFIFRSDQLLGSRVFSESTISIGRGNSCQLRLDDREISRLHATIRVDGARLVIRDEGSQIGTLLNGQPIREKTFREVDTIQIGGFRLKITRRTMAGDDEREERDEPTQVGIKLPKGPPPAVAQAEEDGPDLPAPPPPPAPLPEAKVSPRHGVPTIKLEQVAPVPVAAPAPTPTPVVFVPALAPAPPAPARDSSIEELTAGLEDSAVHALPTPAAPPPSQPEETPLPAPAPPRPTIEEPAIASAAVAALAGPAPAPQEEALDEDDDEDEVLPGFSLLTLLDRDPLPASTPGAVLQLEVVHHQGGRVLDVQQLAPRQNFPATGRRLVRFDTDGRAQLAITEEVGGQVFLGGRAIPLEEIRKGARDRKGVALLEMREGDHAAVVLTRPPAGEGAAPSRSEYHIRFVRTPAARRGPRRPLAPLAAVLGNGYLIGAVLVHALVLGALSLLPSQDAEAVTDEPRFAEVSIKAIHLEPPPPEPKPPEPEPEPTPPGKPEPAQRVRPPRAVRLRHTRAAAPPRSAQDALSALESLKPLEQSGPALKDVVTNINAVSVAPDVRSRFKVGGAIGKLPVGEVRVSTAGVARDATASGRELLSKENIGALKGGGSGNVRGVVKQAPPAALQQAGSGRLSRAQIQKVISDHLAQVQACYEKNLMRDRSLAGKITFDWLITPTGAVSGARVRSSTMAGSAVSSCILGEMRTWAFPTPEGGSVSVTYPFIFSAQGY